jgi:hypothetical protein
MPIRDADTMKVWARAADSDMTRVTRDWGREVFYFGNSPKFICRF